MDFLDDDFLQFVRERNRSDQRDTKKEQQVKEAVTEKYPKIKEFYPIYSDTPDAWQADLTFFWEKAQHYVDTSSKPEPKRKGRKPKAPKTKRLRIAVLCVINVNTRFAFAKVTEFTPAEAEKSESTDKDWSDLQKATSEVVRGSNKTAEKTRDALKKILSEMSSLKGAKLKRASGFKGDLSKLKGYNFRIKTLYTDEGSEFKGAFETFCRSKRIRLVHFTPSTGSKRRLGIVERFNRTLKRLLRLERERQVQGGVEASSVEDLLPVVLENYNYDNPHRGLVETARKASGLAKGKWDRSKVLSKMTPFAMTKKEDAIVNVKKAKRQEVEDRYKDDVRKLNRRPNVRFFKTLDTSDFKRFSDRFQHQGAGTLTDKSYRIRGRHSYGTQQKKGDSFAIDGLKGFRVMPYDVVYPSKEFAKRSRTSRDEFTWQ